MSPTVAVFVSSTWLDLQPERRSVEAAIQRMRATKFIGMEYFGSRPETTAGASLAEVDGSQVYVGILGRRYGSGITEQEYRRAIGIGLPCFIYSRTDGNEAGEPLDTDDAAGAAKLDALKAELRKRHTVTAFTGPGDLAAKVTADLHRWLFDEYLGAQLEPLLHAGGDAAHAAELLSAVRQLRALNGDMLARLEAAGRIDSPSTRVYLDPTPVYERVELDRFVGRSWLRREVETFVEAHERGCFVLEAEAGLGKTAFLAHYAEFADGVHHFVELAPGTDGIVPGLRNIAGQLIQRWQLTMDPAWSAADNVQRRDFLEILFQRAAARRDETAPGRKLVVVIDALDEAGTPHGQNVLGLPRVLPEGVFLVVSQRPLEVALVVEAPRKVVRIEAQDARNLDDAARFVDAALCPLGVGQEAIDALVAKSDGNWVYLHHVLAEIRSGDRSPDDPGSLPRGLWQYYAQYWLAWRQAHPDAWEAAHLPLLATLAALREAGTIEQLARLGGVPAASVGELLDRRWSPFLAMRGQDPPRYAPYHASLRDFLEGRVDPAQLTRQEQVFARGLAEAAQRAHGAIADHYLAAWGGLEGRLPGLRDPALRDRDHRYGFRHVVEHLLSSGRVGDAHAVCGIEREEQEGFEYGRKGLSGLLDRVLGRTPVHRYIRHENVWFAAHEGAGELEAYVADVDRAWRMASARTREAAQRGAESAGVDLEIFYALVKTSIHSTAATLPPKLLDALVSRRVWPVTYAMHVARRVPEPRRRAAAITSLLRHLPDERKAGALREAYRAAVAVDGTSERVDALLPLLAQSAASLLDDGVELAIASAMALQGEDRVQAIARVAPFLTPPACRRAMRAILALDEYPRWRVELIGALAAHANDRCRGRARRALEALLAKSLRGASGEHDGDYGLFALAAAHRQGQDRRDAIDNALRGIDAAEARYPLDYGDFRPVIACLVRLAEAAGGAEGESLMRRAVVSTLALRAPKNRSEALERLAPKLEEPLLGGLVDAVVKHKFDQLDQISAEGFRALALRCAQLGDYARAFRVVAKLDYERARTLCAIAPYLPQRWLQKALRLADRFGRQVRWRSYNEAAARTRDWARERLPALCGLVPRQAELGQVGEAMRAVRSLVAGAEHPEWTVLIEGMAPHLDAPSLRALLGIVRRVGDTDGRTHALAQFAPGLAEGRVRLLLARAQRIGIDYSYTSGGGSSSTGIGMESRGEALAPLGRRLAELGFADEALGFLLRSMSKQMIVYRTRMLMRLAPALDSARLEKLVEATGRIDPLTRASSGHYATLAPHLPPALVAKLLDQAHAVSTGRDEWLPRMLLLGQLVPHLSGELQQSTACEALALWQDNRDDMTPEYGDKNFGLLFPGLIAAIPDHARAALSARMAEIGDESAAALALAERMLPHLPENDAMEFVQGLAQRHGDACLLALVRHLPKAMLLATLESAGAGLDAAALSKAAVRLAALGDTGRALAMLETLPTGKERAAAGKEICLGIPRSDPVALARAWECCWATAAEGTRAELLRDLGALAPAVLRLGGEGVGARVMDASDAVGRCWP
jgi:hypothetical protein